MAPSLFRSLKWLYKAQPQKRYLMMELCLVPRCFSLNENVRAKEGGKETTLPMVPCGSSPVTRVLHLPLRWEKRSAWGGGWMELVPIRSRGWILLHTDLDKAKPNVLGSIVLILGRIKCTRGNGRNSLVIKTSNWLLSAYQDIYNEGLTNYIQLSLR